MLMDIVAVIVVTVVGMGLGALWYGPLLGKTWQAETGLSNEKIADANMGLIMGTAALLELIAAVIFLFMADDGSAFNGVQVGALASMFFAIGLGINYLFERQSMKLYLINIGYMSLTFILMGVIIGFLR